MTEDTSTTALQRQQAYWRSTRRWTAVLMLGWLAATLVMVFWPLAWDFDFWGWPFGFWLGAQGVLLVYWAIVALYAWVQSRADARWRELGTSEDKG